jgi:hypothetical protein
MTTEATPTFLVGDRVRSRESGRVGMIFEIIDADQYHITFGDSGAYVSEWKIELVERRWYSPPGTAMLALTPEVLPHLESCIRQAEYAYGKTPHVEKMRAAIAAAQKEAT